MGAELCPWALEGLAAGRHRSPTLRPGSSPAVFVDFYACGETARCLVPGPGVWASLAVPGLAQTPLSDGLWWEVVNTNLAVPWEANEEVTRVRRGTGKARPRQ